jgi:hypothetical protein
VGSESSPGTVSWAAYWVALGAALTLALGVLPRLLGVPAAVAGVVVVVVAFAVRATAARVVYASALFAEMRIELRNQVVWLLTAATVVHLVLVLGLQLRPRWWGWALLALATLAVVEYAVARSHRLLLTAPPRRTVRVVASQHPDGDGRVERLFNAALLRAGHGGFVVMGWEPVPHGVRVSVQARLAGKSPSRAAAVTLGPGDAEGIAVALMCCIREAAGGDPHFALDSDWVQVRKERGAGAYSITAVNTDVRAKVRPFADTDDWTTIKEPMLAGHELDTQPGTLPLRQHGRCMGKSRSGKSALLHLVLAHITRCRDAVAWVCGTEKLYDFLAGWIEPYDGTDETLPIDWIRSGPDGVLDMLIGAMNLARWRQRQPMSQRGRWPTVVVILDEASFALRNQEVVGGYQGQPVTAAKMAAMIMQGAGGADVWLVLASQRGTQDHFGAQGGDTVVNAGWTAAFATEDPQEVGRLIGDYNLPTPDRPGQFWLKAGTGEPVVQLMAPYVQSPDPTQPVLHDGPTVSDVAWARRGFRRSGCMAEAGPADVIGGGYGTRHRTMGPTLRDYLTGAPDTPTPLSVVDAELEDPQVVIARMATEEAATEGRPAPQTVPSLATILGKRSRLDRVGEILRDADQPLGPGEVLTELHARGDGTATKQTVHNVLGQLWEQGLAERIDRGRYVLAGRPDLTNSPSSPIPLGDTSPQVTGPPRVVSEVS